MPLLPDPLASRPAAPAPAPRRSDGGAAWRRLRAWRAFVPVRRAGGNPHVPWRYAAVAATFGLAAAIFYDFWTPSVFVAASDIFSEEYLRWEWGWQAFFRTGHLPLWNPYLFGGLPAVATFGFCPFYPLAWPLALVPTPLAITMRFVLGLAAGGLGFYAYARATRLAPPRALVAALLYESGSHAIALAFPGHLDKVSALAWMPWALAAAARLAGGGGLRWAIALGAAWALQLLASHSQVFYATFWMAALFVAAAAVRGLATRRMTAAGALGRAAGLALAGAVAAGLSAVQMLPAAEFARASNRGGGLDYKTASYAPLPFDELPEILLPSFRGDSTGRLTAQVWRDDLARAGQTMRRDTWSLPYLGHWHREEGAKRLVSDYAGVWALALALVGLAAGRGGKRWFFAAAATVSALVATGNEVLPLHAWAFDLVPGFRMFRSPGSFLCATHFAIFAMAAVGIGAACDRAAAWSATARRRAAVAALGGAVLAAGGWAASHLADPIPMASAGRETLLAECRQILLLRAWRHVLLALAGGCLALAAVGALRGWAGGRRVALAVFVAVALADPLSHARHFLPRGATADFERLFRANWAETAILADAGDVPLPTTVDVGNELNNRAMVRGVRSLHGSSPVIYADYDKLWRACGEDEWGPFARILARNYATLPPGAAVPAGWHAIGTDPAPPPGVEPRSLVSRDASIALAAVPRRVLPLGALWGGLSETRWREEIGAPDFDPAARTVCEGGYAWSLPEGAAPPVVRCRMTAPGELRLSIVRQRDPLPPGDEQGLVPCTLAVPAADGWRVGFERTAGGGERLASPAGWPRRANGFVMLVPLSADSGVETVVRYRPASFGLGLTVTLFSLCAAAVGLMLEAAWRARRRGTA